MAALSEWQIANKQIAGFPGAQSIDKEAFWTTGMDILIPAALEGQITRERAEVLSCKIVLEGANGPTYPRIGRAVCAFQHDFAAQDFSTLAGNLTFQRRRDQNIHPCGPERLFINALRARETGNLLIGDLPFAQGSHVDAIGIKRLMPMASTWLP